MRTGVVVAIAVCTAARAFAAGTFYVDPSNPQSTDTGSGTQAQPYKTISAAVTARGGAGTTILVAPGTYREEVTIKTGGTASAPFLIQSTTPAAAVIDGADAFSTPAQWVQFSGNIWRAASVSWSPKQVIVDGVRLTASTASTSSLPVNTFRYASGTGLYVNVGGGNPGLRATFVGRRQYGFRISGRSFITLDGFGVTRHEERGFYLSSNANTNVIRNNTVSLSLRSGIYASNCSGLQYTSNVVTDCLEHNIALSSCSGVRVEQNESARSGRSSATACGIQLSGSTSGRVERNRVHHNTSSGIEFGSSSTGCVSVQNRSWSNTRDGFRVTGTTGVRFVNDVSWGNTRRGISIEGSSSGGSIRNTILAANGGTTEYQFYIESSGTSGFSSNDNVIWKSTAQPLVRWVSTNYATLTAFASATSNDTRSSALDPRFTAPATGDFHLETGSPAIDAANSSVTDWPVTDADGVNRFDDPTVTNTGLGPTVFAERGALERVVVDASPVAVLTLTPTGGRAPLSVLADASGSSDPDDGIANYNFDFGDGTITGPQAAPTATHSFAQGPWTVRVTVTDVGGRPSIATRSITVLPPNQPPHAALGAYALTGAPFRPMITDASLVTTAPILPKPAYLTPGTDPVFGTTLTRIGGDTNTPIAGVSGGTWGIDARHHYSKDEPWNADGTRIMIENSGTPRQLMLHGGTYQPLGAACAAYDQGDDRWHVAMPNVRVNVKNTKLSWFDVVNCIELRSWTLPFAVDYFGPSEGNTSQDGRYAALTDGQRMFVVDMDPQPPFAPYPAQRIGPVTYFTGCGLADCTLGWVSISPSGKYVVVKYNNDHPRVYDVDPQTLALTPRPMPPSSLRCAGTAADGFIYDLGHADLALDPDDNNEDIMVGQEHCGYDGTIVNGQLMGRVTKVRLRDGAVTSLTDPTNEAPAHHVSMRNLARPGWAYVTYRSDPGKRFSDEVVAVRTDGSKQVQRFGHKHSLIGSYRSESHAVPSPDGRRVMFVTNWGVDCSTCGPSNDVKSYVFDARDTTAGAGGADQRTWRFDASGSSDSEGALVSYRFDFGDGSSAGPQGWGLVNHTYAYGSYVAKVVVTDADGARDSTTIAVLVEPPNQAPNGVIDDPSADTTTVVVGSDVAFAGTASDPENHTPFVTRWTFGGGAADRNGEDPGLVRFESLGEFLVTFTVTDARGLADPTPDHVVIRVVAPPPDQPPVLSLDDTLHVLADSSIALPVTAVDPDGQPIDSLYADVAALPTVNDALFDVAANHASGTFTWRPRAEDRSATPWRVVFRAANALADMKALVVFVTQPPVVTAPDTTVGEEGQALQVLVQASDPEGDPIASLNADLSDLPPGATPQFTFTPDHTSGTLSWTPGFDAARAEPYRVVFTAANAFAATYTAWIAVHGADSPPTVTAPASFVVPPDSLVSFTVTASDIDGEPLDSLTIDASALPDGNDASFTVNGVEASFAWRPRAEDVRGAPWTVTFTAWNARVGSATTSIIVTRPPVIDAPDTTHVAEGQPLTLVVHATDPDGDAVSGLAADRSGLPSGNNSQFLAPNGHDGTLTWTPTFADGRVAPYPVVFSAANAFSVTRTTYVVVDPVDRAPLVTSPPTATVTEGQLLSFRVTASDPDGDAITSLVPDLNALPSGNNAAFTPDADKLGGTFTWTPASSHGGAPPYRVRFIAGNALSGADTTMITVTDVPDVSNLCGNPSFETNTTGWNGTGSGVLSRVAGGQDGSWAVKVQGPATTAEFGMNDSPNWLLTINAGVRYRYTVWVKSSVGAGRARLKLREYLNSTQVGSSVTSPTLILNTSTWQQLSADFVAQSTGSTLDFQVLNLPNTPSESFFIDNVVIAVVPPSGATPLALAEVSGAPRATETSRIQALPFAQSIRVRPQPMAAAGAIEFNLDHAGPVDVRLYDAAGREVRALLRMTHAEPQRFVVQVPRAATSGARLAAGVYFFRIQCASGRARGRLVISD